MAVTPTPKKRLLLPDNSFLELPDVVTEEDKYRISLDLAQRFPDEYGSLLDPYQTFAGGAAEFFKGIPRGFASSLVGAAQGAVGLVTPGVDTEFESNLAAAQKYLEDESVLAPEEPYKDFFATKLGAGLGSVATYAMPGGIAKALGASATGVAARSAGLGMAVTGGAGEQAQRIQQERELGNDITTGSEAAALLGGAGVGATEMIPINRLFSKVTPETGSALLNIFSRMDKRSPLAGSVSDDIIRLTKGAASQGFAEGLQEGLAGMAQNVVSNVAYDADIEVGDSFLDDLMVGGGVGAIADVIVDAMGGRRTVANKIYRDKEEQLRKQRIERYNAEQAEELRKQRIDEMVKRGQPPEGVLMLPPPAATPSATPTIDGVYTVSPTNNPDRFTRATVFTSPDGKGGLSTMVYSPESEGYFDITEELQRGRSVEDAVAMAVAGDFGFTRDLPALGSAAIKQSFSVAKDTAIPSIDPNRVQAELEGGRFSAPNEDSFIKVQPLPNGSFGLVDVTTGMPVDGGMYSTVNDAFASLRQINDQNAAISAANVLNYTGLVKNNPAYRLAASLRSPKNRLIQKSVVAAYLPKDKRKDLKDFYSPEEAKKLLGPKAFDEMMQGFGQITETNDLLRKYVADPVGINPNKRTITSSALTKLGKDKNLKIDIKDKAFKDYAKYWTGAENWADMSNGQRLYLMTRIANNPAMPEMIKFPNLFQRQYRRPQFEAVLGKLGQAQKDGKTAAISVSDIQKETGLSAPAAKQMFSDLIFSGRVKPVAPGKIQLIRSEQDYQADKAAKAAGLVQNETVEQTASRLRGAGFTDESVKQVEKQVQQQTTEPKSPTPAVKAEIDARETAAIAQGADPQKERTASNFDKIIADALNRYGIAKFVKHQLETDAAKTRKLPNGQIVMRVGYFSPLKKMITVNVGDQINDPNISIDEIVRRISGTVDHEVIHAMREADMFTEQEWNTLSNFVRTAKIDKEFLDQAGDKSLMAVGKGRKQVTTMLDEVRLRYAGKNLNEMQLVEEAVAESFRLWRKHGGKFAAGKPASLFQRILNFVKSFSTAWKGSGATSIDQIFSAVAEGEIGKRTPGLSVFNPSADATIRTLNFADQELSKVKKTIRKGDVARGPVKFKPESFDAPVADVTSEAALEIPLSEADNKRVDDYLESHVGNAPKGYIPKVNTNAPRAAIAAAIKYEQDGKEEPFPDSGRQFMLNEIAEEPIENDIIADNVRRYGKIKPEEMTFGQKAIFILESWKEGGFKSAFDDFSRVFRKAVIDRYNEFRRQEAELIGTENEGMLLAETSASAALGQLDRARGWLASAFNYGGIKWVRGANIVAADPSAFENDKLAGYIDVDESTPGLLNILGPLVNGSVPNGMGQFKTYSTLKRVQGFRSRAKQAQFELSNMPKETQDAATEARRAALKDIIVSANNVRLVDNPSDAQISRLIEEIDTNFPQVTEAYNKYQEWNKTLIQFGRDTGILTEELAERWKQWGDYFPFYQEMEEAVMRDQGFRSKSSMTKVDFFTKALSENAKDLEDADPFEMISKNAFGIIQAGLKNVAAGRILRNSEIVGEARKITGANPAKQASQLRKRGSYIKTVYEDGIEVYYEIADPLLHESMMNYGDPTLNTMTKILAMPANVLREMVTRDPGFVMANMLRDTLSSFVTSGTGYVPVIDTFKQFGMGEIDTLLKTGIVGGYDMSADPQDLKKYIKKQYRKQGIDMRNHAITSTNAVTRVWDWLGDMSTRSDAATRMAVYNAVLKRTGSEAAARQAAIEVLNFSRRGGNPIWKVVTASVPFLNARIQGLDVIYRSLGGKYSPYEGLEDRAVTQKRALMRGAMLAATTGVYFMLMSDNEEYKKTRREVRDDNWLIPAPVLGDKVMLKIPIPFEIGMLFKAVPETFLNFMFGDMDARGFRDSLVRQVNNSTNIDVTGFQIVKPLVDVWRNKDSFTGKEIVPYWVDKGTEAAEQYDERTTEISKFLGNALNVSPMKIDYLVGGYGGSLGLSLFLTTDKIIREASGDKTAGTRADYTDVNNLPVIRRFFYNAGTAGSRQQQEFYELRDEVDKTVATLNKIQKRGDVAEYYAYANTRRGLLEIKSEVLAVERYLKRYRQTREEIIRSDLPADVKRDYLEQLDADRDMRMTIVPVMRERGDIPSRAASAIADAFIG